MNNGKNNGSVIVQDVNHSYGEGESCKQVLFDINLRINIGEIVIMVGPSGSGKTTLLTLIGALRSIQNGGISFFDKDLHVLKQWEQVKVRENIGFIFQAHNLFDSLTAIENVLIALENAKISRAAKRKKAETLLKKLGLGDRMYYKPAKLSGGQRQRVAIARALVNEPKLILADEPTAALDKDTGADVINLFKSLVENNKCAIIIVTHDNRILDAADRIVNMVDGAIVSDVNVKETQYICQFLKSCKLFKDRPSEHLFEISQKMQSESCGIGDTIFRQGDIGTKFYLIRSGKVEILQMHNQKERTINQLESGAFFGEIALMREEPRNATIRALEPTEILTLSKNDFIDSIKKSPSLKDQINKIIVTRG